MHYIPRNVSFRPHQINCYVKIFDALLRNYLYGFARRCESSSNLFIRWLQRVWCFPQALFFLHYLTFLKAGISDQLQYLLVRCLGVCFLQLCLCQRGPTTFDLRTILQKPDNLRATSIKLMCETTDSHDLKLKGEGKWVRHWNFYTIANSNLLQISISMMPVVQASLTLSSFINGLTNVSYSATVVQYFFCHSIWLALS